MFELNGSTVATITTTTVEKAADWWSAREHCGNKRSE